MKEKKKTDYNSVLIHLLELFLVLGVFSFTYKLNLYIIFGTLMMPLAFFQNFKSVFLKLYFFLFISLIPIYFAFFDFNSAYRIHKSIVILLPLLFLPTLSNTQYKMGMILKTFIYLSAILVYLDFILFFTIGNTIMNFTTTDLLPRPCGLAEDSNFYSYLAIIYIYFDKEFSGKYSKFLLFSIVLSGSFSAVLAMVLLSIYQNRSNFSSYNFKKHLYLMLTFIALGIYFLFAVHASEFTDFLMELDVNELLKWKISSMMHRFHAQEAMMVILLNKESFFLGLGVGSTRLLTDREMNLHNTFMQILTETGVLLLIFVSIGVYLMGINIKKIQFLVLFCVLLLLSNVLEVYYYPLLSLIFFLSFIIRSNDRK